MTEYVYVLTNEAMMGLVKIGMTTRSVEQRVKELQSTSVPFPFEVAYSVEVPSASGYIEQEVHRHLADCRVNPDREFFLCSVDAAKIAIDEQINTIVCNFIDDWVPEHTIVENDLYVCPSNFERLGSDMGVNPLFIPSYINFLKADDMLGAKGRFDEWSKERRGKLNTKNKTEMDIK